MRQPFFAAFLAVLALMCFGLGFARAEDMLPPPGHLTDIPQPAGPIAPPVGSANASGDILPPPGKLVDTGANSDAASQPAALQLEVMIDGYKINMVAGFSRLADGSLTSARSELGEIGIKAPGSGKADEQIALNSIPSLTYKFDEKALTIDLSAPDSARIPKAYDVVPKQDMLAAADGGYGMVLNYGAYGAANANLGAGNTNFTGASVNLDARAYAPFGVLQQTGIVGTTTFSDATTTRLDTTWTSSNQNRAETYRVGDFVSGGLDWTRPVRMGGLEAQRNFSIRPDLITTPMANFSGSAAVPSTLDVFVNGMKTYSQQVQPGPFQVDRMPVISAQGDAQLVLTDTSGRQTAVTAPLYSSPLLLAPKLFDYSVDLGLARLNYGVDSFDYNTDPMLIASGRYGLTKSITGQAHFEGKSDLIEAGLGGVFQAGRLGTFNIAAALSDYQGSLGGFSYLAWDWEKNDFRVHASSSRTFGNFNDLAAVTANQQVTPGSSILSAAVPLAVDQLTATYGVPDLQLTVGGGIIHYLPASGTESLLISANATKSLRHSITLFANAYIDSLDTSNFGFGVGFSMPLGGVDKSISASSAANYDNKNGPTLQAAASKPLDSSYGSYGWRVNGLYNNGTNLSASGAYRAEQALVSADVNSNSSVVSGDMRVEGSFIGTKAGVFAGNQVQDAFAVVDAGVPGVRVEYENRYAGTTGKSGKLLLTDLQSYRPSKISIDPNTLPLNSNVTDIDKRVAARTMSGVVVDFGVKKDTGSALVIMKDKTGAFVKPGTLVTVEDQKDPFPMGYDGQVYLTGLKPKNAIVADMEGTPCKVSFNYKEDEAKQVIIGPLTCE